MDATTGSRKGIAPAVAFLVSDNASFKSNASSANYSKRSHFTRRVLLLARTCLNVVTKLTPITSYLNAALHLDTLRAAGCDVIHEDSASGVSCAWRGLDRALVDLRAGDL